VRVSTACASGPWLGFVRDIKHDQPARRSFSSRSSPVAAHAGGSVAGDRSTPTREGVAMPEALKGACLCGSVEYEVRDPEALGYCHCTRCQRWTGSSLAGVVVAKENFRFTKGEDLVTRYESEFAPRNFCSK